MVKDKECTDNSGRLGNSNSAPVILLETNRNNRTDHRLVTDAGGATEENKLVCVVRARRKAGAERASELGLGFAVSLPIGGSTRHHFVPLLVLIETTVVGSN